jgi:DNA primase
MPTWIDFKALRQKLSFEQVLGFYRVEIKRKGQHQHQGFCPLPNHEGKRRSPSFSANLQRGIFHCFGCGAKGNLLEFACLMSGISPDDRPGLRQVALRLEREFCPGGTSGREPSKPVANPKGEVKDDAPVVVNAPLDFELKGLNSEHPYLRGRGFTAETIAHFGLGVASRGLLKDRLAIPLHGQDGALLGYAGRVIDDAAITEDNPRYKFPSKRDRAGVLHEFRKTQFLYNGFRVESPVEDLIVVEGFTGVWWLEQRGFAPAVATMGSDCSATQAELIVTLVKPNGRVWLVPDGDAAGLRYSQSVLSQVAPHRFIRWVKLADGQQPTDLALAELQARFRF